MEFNVNASILFVLVGVIIAAVVTQSVYFLVKAIRRAKAIGIKSSTLRATVTSAILFTIAPAIAVLVGVVTLSKALGIAIPWLRLSVIGSITYETVAAENTLNAVGHKMSEAIDDSSLFVSVLWVMTLAIAAGLILVPFVTKKIQGGMNKMTLKDKKWGEIFNNAMFLGMISAFLGFVFCDVGGIVHGKTEGLIPVVVMFTAAVVMAILGIIATKLKIRWLTDYALPASLIAGMAIAIPVTNLLG